MDVDGEEVIDWLLKKVAARFWQARTHRALQREEVAEVAEVAEVDSEWHAMFPDRCMYCSYTRWANEEHGQSLKIDAHVCKEGNSPPHPLPVAKVVR